MNVYAFDDYQIKDVNSNIELYLKPNPNGFIKFVPYYSHLKYNLPSNKFTFYFIVILLSVILITYCIIYNFDYFVITLLLLYLILLLFFI